MGMQGAFRQFMQEICTDPDLLSECLGLSHIYWNWVEQLAFDAGYGYVCSRFCK